MGIPWWQFIPLLSKQKNAFGGLWCWCWFYQEHKSNEIWYILKYYDIWCRGGLFRGWCHVISRILRFGDQDRIYHQPGLGLALRLGLNNQYILQIYISKEYFLMQLYTLKSELLLLLSYQHVRACGVCIISAGADKISIPLIILRWQ